MEPLPGELSLHLRLRHLEKLMKHITEENYFTIHGTHHLQGTQWKDKIFNLLHHIHIPYYWIVDIEKDSADGNVVKVMCINTFVSQVIKIRLQKYLNQLTSSKFQKSSSD